MESMLVRKCIESAASSPAAVEKWRRQRRTLEQMPAHLADPLLAQLHRRRLLYPSLLELFKYNVEEVDFSGGNSVDAEWMAYLGAFEYLRSLVLADCHKMNNSALWSITGLKHLKELDISRCSKITNSGIRHLLSVPLLEKLYISETGVTEDGVQALASLTNLLVLDLGGLPVTDSALWSLKVLKKLQSLDLWGSKVSNDGAIILEMFPDLSTLNLGWTGVSDLPNLPSLTCLNMSQCTIFSLLEGKGSKPCIEKLILAGATITNNSYVFQYIDATKLFYLDLSSSALVSFIFLKCFNALTHLNLSDTSIADDSMVDIALAGENLEYLNLNKTRVSSEGVAALAGKLLKLETLLLSHTSIDDKAIEYISMLPALRVLNLSGTSVKGLIHQEEDVPEDVPSFSALQTLCHLERLDLEDMRIEDCALLPLASLGGLSYLSLRSVSITNASLHHFSSAKKLKHLGIQDAVLTDSGIKEFVPPATMKVLDLSGCWLLTKDALVHFCNKYPLIEVRHEFVEPLQKTDLKYPSPSQSKHDQKILSASPSQSDERFLDQRVKYTREELLTMQTVFEAYHAAGMRNKGKI